MLEILAFTFAVQIHWVGNSVLNNSFGIYDVCAYESAHFIIVYVSGNSDYSIAYIIIKLIDWVLYKWLGLFLLLTIVRLSLHTAKMYLSRCLEQKKKLYLLRCATNSLAKSLCALLWNKNGAVLRVYPWSYDAYKSIPDWSDINWSECSMFSHNQELMQVLTQWGTTPATNKQKWRKPL